MHHLTFTRVFRMSSSLKMTNKKVSHKLKSDIFPAISEKPDLKSSKGACVSHIPFQVDCRRNAKAR